jgi:hypothetical protein
VKARWRGHNVLTAVICGGVVFASAIAGLIVFTRTVGSNTASDRYQTGTIQLGPQGSTCQRLVIDNNTFTIKPGQQLPCGDAPKNVPKEAARSTAEAPSRYSSGGRVDAIRDSFKNR